MTDQFDKVVADVKRKFGDPQASAKHCVAALSKNMPSAGIYLFSENGLPLYVGRTNSLRKRLQYHTRNNHNQATFEFLLARHQTGNLKASYRPKGLRQDLLNNQTFRAAFDAARQRIREMDVQFVEVGNMGTGNMGTSMISWGNMGTSRGNMGTSMISCVFIN